MPSKHFLPLTLLLAATRGHAINIHGDRPKTTPLCDVAMGAEGADALIAFTSGGIFSRVATANPGGRPNAGRPDDFASFWILPYAREIIADAPQVERLAWYRGHDRDPWSFPRVAGRVVRLATTGYHRRDLSSVSITLYHFAQANRVVTAVITIQLRDQFVFKEALRAIENHLNQKALAGPTATFEMVSRPGALSLEIPALGLSAAANRKFLGYLIKRFGPDSRITAIAPANETGP